MLHITIPAVELYDEKKCEFVYIKEQTLQLEHSLVSISKWESKWNKSFLFAKDKTDEEMLDYIKCMTITQNVNPQLYEYIPLECVEQIRDYIYAPMTATVFGKTKNNKPNSEIVTAELIYYWMIALNIPLECQKWHLNRLFTLIRVCSIKNQPDKKMSKRELMSRNAALNEARRKKLNSKG